MDSHLGLTAEERAVLQALTRSRHSRAGEVRRARLIMMLDAGVSWSDISEQLPCRPDFIGRWKGRFETERLGGLYARHRGRAPANDMAQLEARVLAWKTWSRESALWSSVWFRPHAEVFCYFVCTGLVRRRALLPRFPACFEYRTSVLGLPLPPCATGLHGRGNAASHCQWRCAGP